MSTQDLILSSFKALLLENPLSKITVAGICEKAHISRKTFYVYFDDKEGLIRKVIHEDLLRPTEELRRLLPTEKLKSAPKMLIEQLHNGLYSRRDFYKRLVSQMGRYEFLDLLISEVVPINRQILQKSGLSKQEQEYKAYFFASSHCILIMKWIEEDFDISTREITNYFYKWALCTWPGDYEVSPHWNESPEKENSL